MGSFRDDVPPWSFFIPITLAVIVGVLAADAIRYAIGNVFGGEEPQREAEMIRELPSPAAQRAAERAANRAAEQAALEAEPRSAPRMATATRSEAGGRAVDTAPAATARGGSDAGELPGANGVLELPDAMSARRDGDPAACVNGTVVNRVAGGWEQALEDDAPVPCVTVNH